MKDEREVARAGLRALIEPAGTGPDWEDIAAAARRPAPRRLGPVVALGALTVTLMIVGVLSIPGAERSSVDVLAPPPSTAQAGTIEQFDGQASAELGERWWRGRIEGDGRISPGTHPDADIDVADLIERVGLGASASVSPLGFGEPDRPQLCWLVRGSGGRVSGSLVFERAGDEWLVFEIRPNVQRCTVDDAVEWSIEMPPGWHADGSSLMPNLGWRSFTFATFPLRAGGECAHMPTQALVDLGPDDALISIFDARVNPATPVPPSGLSDEAFPATGSTDASECAGRPDLEVHWDAWQFDGRGVYVLIAFGDTVSEVRRADAWSTISSLRFDDAAAPSGFCVVTRPTGFTPDATIPSSSGIGRTYPALPVDPYASWYGTDELWTVLDRTGLGGAHASRKSVWWSEHFLGGKEEPTPQISVVYRNVHTGEVHAHEEGTNAYTEADGWFMIAGIDVDEPGCWSVEAEYRNARLGYVYSVP